MTEKYQYNIGDIVNIRGVSETGEILSRRRAIMSWTHKRFFPSNYYTIRLEDKYRSLNQEEEQTREGIEIPENYLEGLAKKKD